MEEPEVFQYVLQKVKKLGWTPYVHIPSAHHSKYQEVLNSAPQHSITIDGRYPDILGFDRKNRIVAVEVKGDSSVLKGVGQALHYQKGAQKSFLACDENVYLEVEDILQRSGINGFSVGKQVRIHKSPSSFSPNFLPDTERELNRLNLDFESMGKLTRLKLRQPLNFLAPALILKKEQYSQEKLKEEITESYNFHAPNHLIKGARVLNIIKRTKSERLKLGENGEIANKLIKSEGIHNLRELKEFKDSFKHGERLINKSKILGIFLKKVFQSHPEFIDFLEILHQFSDQVSLYEYSKTLLIKYPNLFLSLFCSNRKKDKVEKKLESGKRVEDFFTRDFWRDVILSNIKFNFTGQLTHIGILREDTKAPAGKMSDYDPDEYPWLLKW